MDANALDREEGWRAGTTRKHMQEHLNAYHDDSNDKCALCVAPNRKDLEAAIVDLHLRRLARLSVPKFRSARLSLAEPWSSLAGQLHRHPIQEQETL